MHEGRWHDNFLTENRQLLGELSGIDTLLQCLSVSSFHKKFKFASIRWKKCFLACPRLLSHKHCDKHKFYNRLTVCPFKVVIHQAFLLQLIVQLCLTQVPREITWPQLFKGWITLFTGEITIQWIAWLVLSIFIHWIAIYPVDSVIQPLNNWALVCNVLN